jgi:aminoglycoside 6'-N-acetyltransferase I
LRQALWPHDGAESHAREVEQFLAGRLQMPLQVLLAADESGKLVGFAELSIRAYAEACVTNRVAYLEGWYVAPEARRHGIGAILVRAAEEWARAQGCTEIGADALLDNEVIANVHLALGFEETVQLRCFRKQLDAPPVRREPERRRP